MTGASTAGRRRPTYPAALQAEVRRMVEAGWKPYELWRYLQKRDGEESVPSYSTLLYWADDKRYASHKARQSRKSARQMADAATFRLRGRSPEWVEAFVLRLSAEGAKPASIAAVTRVVLDEPLSRNQVEYIVRAKVRDAA